VETCASSETCFYDPGYHGLDIVSAEKLYTPYLEGIAARADLNYLFERCWRDHGGGHGRRWGRLTGGPQGEGRAASARIID